VNRTALDTSVVVASLLRWHADHGRAASAVSRARTEGDVLVLPVPALLQSFSVMTRLPRGYRAPPEDALAALRREFGTAELATCQPRSAWGFLEKAVAAGVAGEGIHDADILACAERAGATRLLTLNPRDFERLRASSVEIVAP
jgi:predicted nucleic acid-binding protein